MEISTITAQEFGELIRVNREALGLSVEDIAVRLKLSKSTVRAIESGQVEDMPYAVYAKGFVRSYARIVGISPNDLQAGITAFFPDNQFDEVSVTPGPASVKLIRQPGLPNLKKFIIPLIVICVFCLAGWYIFSNFDSLRESFRQPISAIFSETDAAPSEGSPATSSARESETPPPAVNIPSQVSELTNEQPFNSTENSVLAPAAGETGASGTLDGVPSAQAPPGLSVQEPVAGPTIATGKQIAIQANDECWIQVSIDGVGSRTFTLQAGDASLFPYKNRITVVLGNSGGVSLTHNGKLFDINGRPNEKRTLNFQ